ncbi:kinase-like protein [Gigaspora margarita]|uniref:Kinase-like protein n=1 Tax=Gigaspora margarita TaxID=4874 RepID=A0A8H4EHZ1_GIGMA|nr:kinase-like protein [Gigaspora margarita]
MQFADNGTLKDYLKEQKEQLYLNRKIYLNKAILKGLKFLHDQGIVHRDLHSKNVLIHNGEPLLADFGLSKSLLESKDGYMSEIRGVQAYVDPKLLVKSKFNRHHEKASDIYSFGVLMWEIYTCCPPFENNKHDYIFAAWLYFGLREERKVGMPMKYIEIYEKCWNPDPSLRPEISDILRDLECLEKEEGPTCTEQNISLTESPVQYSTIPKNLPNYTAQMQLHSILTVDLKQSITLDTFLPLFEKIHQLRKTWIPLNMQLNKKMCRRLGQCIIDAEHNICTLENQLDIRADDPFITLENYVSFQAFLRNIESIKYFIENISQIGGLKSFVRVIDSTISLNLLKNEYIKLLTEFNESISSLNFESRINKQVSDITSEVDDDIEETIKFIEALQCNFDEVDYMFGFIDQINNSIKNSSTNDDLFYDQTMKSIKEFKDGNIQKTDDGSITIIKQFHQDDQDEKNDIFVQAKLLKASKGLINIAKFYGIIQDTSSPNSRYVIIEWSDHGNLKEYYVKHKPLNPLIKLNFAFDICNGLVFLNALNFLHCDIRPENILITGSTSNLKAKITNFFHSRLMTDETKNIGVGPGIRYIAPEILKRNTYTHNTYTHNTHTHSLYPPDKYEPKYDFKCEAYR